MAGIGFVLRDLDRRDTITGSISSAGHGMIVAAGPWLFTVVSLALIHRGTSTALTSDQSYSFRSFVMYAFALSLLATAPFVNVAIRLASDDIYRQTFTSVRARFLAALFVGSLASAAVALAIHISVFGLAGNDLVLAVCSTAIVALIWPTLAFCGAVRDYKGITTGFGVGMLVSILGTIWIARQGFGAAAMIGMFLLGLSIVFFTLASRILLAFPDQVGGLGTNLLELVKGLRQHWMLAGGSLFAIAAIWADKWIMWVGPDQVVLSNGLFSAPAYDGAMFLAYLVMIPALGLFVTAIETTFFEDSRRLFDAIQGQAPLGRIERYARDLEKQTYRMVYRVLMTLAAFCAVSILLSPVLVPIVGLQYHQLGIFRLGILAVFFQFMFVAATSIVLFLDRQARFLTLQLIFFTAQVGFTLMTIVLGQEYFGYGHLLACAFSAFLAMAVLDRTLGNVVFLSFATAFRRPNGATIPAVARKKVANNPIRLEEEVVPVLPVLQSGPLLRP
ncbi:exopolysaccharide Pel transporter PelG [Mesorhizobium sp. IMUNJ 23232]|uniref:exopolysaccharide Pel transporter PelG n=1 Tax=Mesorhizobium sp. IMUNJ 23232 TaxID=3376064 RepID=UPI003792E022